MKPTRVTASEFQMSFGALSEKARQQPVVITKHGRDSLVVMSAEEWERLKRRDRKIGLTADLPDEWIEAVRNADTRRRLTLVPLPTPVLGSQCTQRPTSSPDDLCDAERAPVKLSDNVHFTGFGLSPCCRGLRTTAGAGRACRGRGPPIPNDGR